MFADYLTSTRANTVNLYGFLAGGAKLEDYKNHIAVKDLVSGVALKQKWDKRYRKLTHAILSFTERLFVLDAIDIYQFRSLFGQQMARLLAASADTEDLWTMKSQ